ncbi:glycine receptor subunit alpha-4-like [Tropilaelaps mercedesae]|uniref:Glycine receptor subunit alpha-4-like n=1 Tax=Tropilaelaps mercedesae TaxID=418985 RepID=A0A1V9XYZ4_9ACAR|nr:glycine receptor subunit alpha-4-like [Tropilaelaps mercedesae]
MQVENFWVPDIYFVEAKDVSLPSKVSPPRALQLHNNGKNKNCRMIYKVKETLTVGCNLNFWMFPIDVNRCQLNIRSCMSYCCTKYNPCDMYNPFDMRGN